MINSHKQLNHLIKMRQALQTKTKKSIDSATPVRLYIKERVDALSVRVSFPDIIGASDRVLFVPKKHKTWTPFNIREFKKGDVIEAYIMYYQGFDDAIFQHVR